MVTKIDEFTGNKFLHRVKDYNLKKKSLISLG